LFPRNEIGLIEVEAHKPLFFGPYRRNPFTGSSDLCLFYMPCDSPPRSRP
jgi:sulfate adenylyltransferase subunit 1 (EFTu-like GTPase family)